MKSALGIGVLKDGLSRVLGVMVGKGWGIVRERYVLVPDVSFSLVRFQSFSHLSFVLLTFTAVLEER